MSLLDLFTDPFFSGTASSVLVPTIYPVAVAGHPYFLDTSPEFADYRWRHETIPLLRGQADQARTPAETSLNPDVYWRRAQDSWHHGAGQDFLDRDDLADPYRFRSSKGLDVWDRYMLSLLHATDQKKSGSSTNYRLAVAGTRLYLADSSNLYYTSDITVDSPTWTAVTGYSGGSILSLCSDGFNVYFTDGANVWTTTSSSAGATSANTEDIDVLGFVKGRLLGAEDGEVFTFTAAGTSATLFSPDLTGTAFTWVGFAEGNTVIYMAGYVGDKSTIWKTAITADGTVLAIPTVAGTLPDGEIIRAIYGYLGNLYIGSDKGWRFATTDANGNLSIGALVTTVAAVNCFEGQDRFVWYGYSNYDTVSTGLGRSDFTQAAGEPGSNQIAYASDLMATTQGAVLSVATFQNKRVFTVSAVGVFAEDTPLVASGTIDSGGIGFGLPDSKTLGVVDVRTEALDGGSWSAAISADGGTFSQVGATVSTVDTTGNALPSSETAERFELRLTLTRDGSVTSVGPVILRWTLKGFPAPQDGQVQRIYLPLMFYTDLSGYGIDIPLDVRAEHNYIDELRATREVIALNEIDRVYSGIVEDTKFLPHSAKKDVDGQWRYGDGTMLVIFKVLS